MTRVVVSRLRVLHALRGVLILLRIQCFRRLRIKQARLLLMQIQIDAEGGRIIKTAAIEKVHAVQLLIQRRVLRAVRLAQWPWKLLSHRLVYLAIILIKICARLPAEEWHIECLRRTRQIRQVLRLHQWVLFPSRWIVRSPNMPLVVRRTIMALILVHATSFDF